ncbi:MAG: MMPL family transporter [Deltaproteobacteria bacterium]|nr:MMPL family transporter [Deltaproteobacteria bacterium]
MKNSSTGEIKQTFLAQEQRLLRSLVRLSIQYPWMVLLFCLAVAVWASFYTIQHLEFVASRNALISSNKRYIQFDEEYADEFVGIDQLVVVVEPRDVQQGKEFVSRLAEILNRDTAHVREVFYQIDVASLEGKKLLYLSSEDLGSLHDNLEEYHDLVRDLTTAPGLNTLFRAINQQVSSGMVSHLVSGFLGLDSPTDSAGEKSEEKPLKLTFLKSLLQEMERALSNADYSYRSPWAEFFCGTDELSDNGYLISENRRFVFVEVEPNEEGDGFNEGVESIAAIRQAVRDLRQDFPGLAAGVTGTKAINNDDMVGAQSNSNLAAVISLVGVTLLYLLFFRRLSHPLLIVSALTVGLAWTMGFVTYTVGHLTIITAFVAPILIGLADDFGVHFVTRYEEERDQGLDAAAALTEVFFHAVPAISAGAFTTALAFFAVMLADFRGMQELGWITGGGLLLSLLATLTFLPALLIIFERHRPWEMAKGGRTFLTGTFAHLGTTMERARWPLLTLLGLITLGSLIVLPTVSFDYNLLNLQARGTESVKWEKRILANSERSSWNALSTAPTAMEAMRKAAAFQALSSVETVESVASLIPSEQEDRLPLVRALQPWLNDLPPTLASPAPVNVPDMQRTLDKLKLKIREESDEWDPQKKPSARELGEVRENLLTVIDHLQRLSENEAREALERFQQPLFLDFQDKWALLRNNVNPSGPITLADIPLQLKSRFVSQDEKKFLLQIYPKKNIWDREPLEEFIGQLRQVDPDIAGSPVTGYESIKAMKEGYVEGGMYALIAILLVTFLTLHRVGDTLLAILPLALGMVWTMGWMWLFNLHFNLANLITVPLIIGIGVENGIHLVHRFREEGEGGPTLIAGSTGQAVALFSLTTMIGFGSLMVASYYGIFSMGLLLTVAVGSVLVASLTVLPLILFRPSPTAAPTLQADPTVEEEELPLRQRMARRG